MNDSQKADILSRAQQCGFTATSSSSFIPLPAAQHRLYASSQLGLYPRIGWEILEEAGLCRGQVAALIEVGKLIYEASLKDLRRSHTCPTNYTVRTSLG